MRIRSEEKRMTGFEQEDLTKENQPLGQEATKSYFLDAENIAEMARIELQSRLMTQGMGGAFPELDNQLPAECHRVLDLCCGTGEWVQHVAHAFPGVEVVGLDSSDLMLSYARATAGEAHLDHAHFIWGNVLKPLPFVDNAFDLVNARFLIGVVYRDCWPVFLSECMRVVRPGGLIRLTEGDRAGHSNKPACEQFAAWAVALFHRSNYGFGNDPRSVGLTAQLPALLQQAGCQRIFQSMRTLDCSSGTDLYESQCQNWRIAYIQMQPVLKRLGIATAAEIEAAYERLLKELMEPDFRATTTLVTVLGYKPPE